MHVVHTKIVDCLAMTAEECSDQCLVALGHGPGFKLRADTPDDVVHGAVTIAHNFPPEPHEISVDVYEQDDLPNTRLVHGRLEGRRSTLKRPAVMPTARAIRDRLNAWTTP